MRRPRRTRKTSPGHSIAPTEFPKKRSAVEQSDRFKTTMPHRMRSSGGGRPPSDQRSKAATDVGVAPERPGLNGSYQPAIHRPQVRLLAEKASRTSVPRPTNRPATPADGWAYSGKAGGRVAPCPRWTSWPEWTWPAAALELEEAIMTPEGDYESPPSLYIQEQPLSTKVALLSTCIGKSFFGSLFVWQIEKTWKFSYNTRASGPLISILCDFALQVYRIAPTLALTKLAVYNIVLSIITYLKLYTFYYSL